jgi:hypothetical protein
MSLPVAQRTFVVAALALALCQMSVAAHHAFSAEFDREKPVKVQGKVTKMEWVNPHAWLYLDVVGDDGKTVNWGIELGAPNALVRRGWRTDAVKAGVDLVIEGYQAKNGKSVANGRNVKFPDGRELFVGSAGTGAPSDSK